MKLRSVLPMKVAKYGSVAIAAVFCLAGLGIMLMPAPPAAAIGAFFGIALVVFGAIKLVGYFSKDLFRLAFQYDLQFGILMIVLGGITLARRANATEFICVAFGVCLLADCLFKIGIAFDARRFGIRQWWMTLVLAILGGVMGVLVMLCPAVLMWAVKTLLGLSLMVEGFLSLSVALSMIKIIDHQQPDVIYADACDVWEEK